MGRRDLNVPVDITRRLISCVTWGGEVFGPPQSETDIREIVKDMQSQGQGVGIEDFPYDGPWWNDYIEENLRKPHPQLFFSQRTAPISEGTDSVDAKPTPARNLGMVSDGVFVHNNFGLPSEDDVIDDGLTDEERRSLAEATASRDSQSQVLGDDAPVVNSRRAGTRRNRARH